MVLVDESNAAYFDEDPDKIFDNEVMPGKCSSPQCRVSLIVHDKGDNCDCQHG
jgi:hypothetical protein